MSDLEFVPRATDRTRECVEAKRAGDKGGGWKWNTDKEYNEERRVIRLEGCYRRKCRRDTKNTEWKMERGEGGFGGEDEKLRGARRSRSER